MNIGILTMQRVINHGSFLQSYALKHILQDLGHEVSFVDIVPGEKIVKPITSFKSSSPFFAHFLSKINHVLFNRSKKSRFEKRFFPMIGINKPVKPEQCDLVVVGSDEVFNFYQGSPWGLTDQLFGKIGTKAISYAGSFGNTDIGVIEKCNLKQRLSTDMKCFSAISVRDKNSFECVKYLTGIEPYIHLDPVLIYGFKDELPDKKILRFHDYIAVYSYENGFSDDYIDAIKRFAKEHHKKVISIGFYNSWVDYNLICSPFELLAYFKNADFVVTNTFHGSVLAIKYNRKFVSVLREKNINKLWDLLARFGLEERIVSDPARLEDVLDTEIDYSDANAFILRQQNCTNHYLIENVK